jgi:hypothetical protein
MSGGRTRKQKATPQVVDDEPFTGANANGSARKSSRSPKRNSSPSGASDDNIFLFVPNLIGMCPDTALRFTSQDANLEAE